MARRDEGFFSSRDNTRLYWQSVLPDGEPSCIVGIVHGYGDHAGRYRRLIDALVADGLGVMALDFHGQGKSDGRRGYCAQWVDYVDDLEVFWARLRGAAQGKPTFLLAHSHGALVALHWVLRKPEGLKGLVLTSPFLKVAVDPPLPKVLAARVVGTLVPWMPVPMGLTFAQLSRDPQWQQETEADPLYVRNATPRWFVQCTAAQVALAGRGREITVPLYVTAGAADTVVSTPAAKAFFDSIGSADKTFEPREGMRHEVLCELGKEAVWADISRWICSHR